MSSMHPKKRSWLWLIVLCGTLVPVSYVHGLVTHPEARGELWGGVPEALQPLYTISMLLATLGFFLFTGFISFRVDPHKDLGDGRPGFGIFLHLDPNPLRPLAAPYLCLHGTSVHLALVGHPDGPFPGGTGCPGPFSRPVRFSVRERRALPHSRPSWSSAFLVADCGPGRPCLAVLFSSGFVNLGDCVDQRSASFKFRHPGPLESKNKRFCLFAHIRAEQPTDGGQEWWDYTL